MSTTTDLLDRFKALKRMTSDAELGRALKLKPSSVSNYRQGVRHAEPETVRRLAEELGEDVAVMMLRVQIERETQKDRRDAWTKVLARISTAATICLAVYTSIPSAHGKPGQIGHNPNVIDIAVVIDHQHVATAEAQPAGISLASAMSTSKMTRPAYGCPSA